MNKKEQFIRAYQWAYGVSKKHALEAYRDYSKHWPHIIDNIIESFDMNARKAFYED